ncbi:hypothetical protein OUZ56_012152 [Daphnia magna]|uniref:Uncharacterized protein n=1 Tax=Daphnia magna TaxID=35525 RepID=A0ABQ9Z264_9CRUS|nr:hypothetical protein OUZ56_012152 [Daphnia magna]
MTMATFLKKYGKFVFDYDQDKQTQERTSDEESTLACFVCNFRNLVIHMVLGIPAAADNWFVSSSTKISFPARNSSATKERATGKIQPLTNNN